MKFSRYSHFFIIGLYGFFYALVTTIGTVLTQEWYRDRSREVNIRHALTFDQDTYANDANLLDAQNKLILGSIEIGFLILGSILIIQYSRSKYFDYTRLGLGKPQSKQNIISLVSIGMLGGLIFYLLVFIVIIFTKDLSNHYYGGCGSLISDLKLCSESFPTFIGNNTISFFSLLMTLLTFIEFGILGAIYPSILLIYLSVRRDPSHETYPVA